MSETLTIEAVSAKFANKYSSGSILAGGKWMQVASKLDLKDFQKGSSVVVETKTNDKGYTSIVGLVKESNTETVETVEKAIAEARTKTSKRTVADPKVSYDEIKTRHIFVQGITQAVAQSPMLAGLPFTNAAEAIQLIQDVSLALIAFVDDESK